MADPTETTQERNYDVAVIGGGPAGATAAHALAQAGRSVLLLDGGGRPKPCGGAVPPRLLRDYAIPESLLVARATSARMVSPTDRRVDIPIEGGWVGMVERSEFDPWLRRRAALSGAHVRSARFERLEAAPEGGRIVHFRPFEPGRGGPAASDRLPAVRVGARCVIGADGARSMVARQAIPEAKRQRHVYAYHEIVRSPPAEAAASDRSRCEVHYRGALSPDFYGWVFPHGATTSVGTGSADRGFSLRGGVEALRAASGLAAAETLRREGAPIPMAVLPRWDDGQNVLLAGDAAGVVAPSSGEGIYYAMESGRMAAETVDDALRRGHGRDLRLARMLFLREHGRVFWILRVMQHFWYANDRRRERFVEICRDPDVQRLTFEAYMNKQLVRARPWAHARIFCKDVAHLLGLVHA